MRKVMEIEHGTFTPLVFTTTGGMADECVVYHSRLAELIANKKGEIYSSAISLIRAKVSFAKISVDYSKCRTLPRALLQVPGNLII